MKPELYDREPIAYHELGYVVAFRFYGYNVESVKVGDKSGCTVLPKQTVNAFHYIVALCAGKAAIDRWYGWKSPTYDEKWRKSDEHDKVYQVALKVSQGDREAAALLVQWGERVAGVLVEKYWDQFPGVVEALVEHGRLAVGNEVT